MNQIPIPETRKGKDVEDCIERLLEAMSLDEKIGIIHSATKFSNRGVPRLGIPDLHLSDGPHGVREEISADSWEPAGWDNDTATYLPVGTAQASTFSPALLRKAGEVLGAEARERRKDIILGPGINLLRTPLCGRIFEYYSEDPCLTAILAAEAVRGIQSQDTSACIKHFALNNQELNRSNNDAVVDEKTLHDHYLAAFEYVVKNTEVGSVMGSYNRFRGIHCSQNRELLQEILKDTWGFEGFVVTDWNAVFDTTLAVESGLDLEMGTEAPSYDDYFMAKPYQKGIEEGRYSLEGLNEKVRRILRVMFLIGVFDPNRKNGARNTPEHQQVALDIAREAIVLLKNDRKALPWNLKPGDKLLVIGENASMRHASGGNSSAVKAAYEITPLEGLKAQLPEGVELLYEPGYPESESGLSPIPTTSMTTVDQGSGVKGWRVRYFGNRHFEGEALKTAFVENAAWDQSLNPLPVGIPETLFSIEWDGAFIAEESGNYEFGVFMDGVAQLQIDDETRLDIPHTWTPSLFKSEIELTEGQHVQLRVRYAYRDSCQRFEFGYTRPSERDLEQENVSKGQQALEAARQADHVLFIGGLNHQFDLESRDRRSLELPFAQDDLIARLLEIRPDAVVALITGSPVTLPWLEQCETLIWMSYNGMEGGTALAEVLLGKINPSGHLPFSFPKSLKDTGAHSLGTYEETVSRYDEKDLCGYRFHLSEKVEPHFYFGEGLSYGRIEWGGTELRQFEDRLEVEFRLRCPDDNPLPLKKAFQVYVQSPGFPIPVLRGFAKLSLTPGEKGEGLAVVPFDDLKVFSTEKKQRILPKGSFTVWAGFASHNCKEIGQFQLR